jgi:type I restriction enzyme R subunit
LRYATIETPEKHYLLWREESDEPGLLDRPLMQLCDPARLLEIVHDFIVFDAGTKKICRHNQYFGVRAAQERVRRREGGIIWHTQGSGKSLTMVWLARWIRENVRDSRVLIVTDRTELDEQIKNVFKGVNEDIYRAKNGADLISQLNANDRYLICFLVHKFGSGEAAAAEGFVQELKESLPWDFQAKGELFVFVDECHRTQAGKLHRAMKTILPNAMFIGFTGTPLLKADKQKSIEIFGPYIHTYKYDEAVRDGAVLDLRYEARDIDQDLTSPERVDRWFEAKTRGLTDTARVQLKKKWGTMQKVLSSRDRLEKIVDDILLDMETRETVRALCEPVPLSRNTIDYIHYFCAEDTTDKDAVKANERKRVALYKGVASFVRAYANLANEMPEAGYTPEQAEDLTQKRNSSLRKSPPGGEDSQR